MSFTKKQKEFVYKMIELELLGKRPTEIIAELGVSKNMFYNIKRQKEYSELYESRRQDGIKRAVASIEREGKKYIDVIQRIIDDPETDTKTRLDAAKYMLDHVIGKPTTKTEQTITTQNNTEDKDISAEDLTNEVNNIMAELAANGEGDNVIPFTQSDKSDNNE